MAELDDELVRLRTELAEADDYLRIGELRARLPQLETEMGRPDLWDDADRARQILHREPGAPRVQAGRDLVARRRR